MKILKDGKPQDIKTFRLKPRACRCGAKVVLSHLDIKFFKCGSIIKIIFYDGFYWQCPKCKKWNKLLTFRIPEQIRIAVSKVNYQESYEIRSQLER